MEKKLLFSLKDFDYDKRISMVPSESMRDLFKAANYQFDSHTAAAMLYHSHISIVKRIAWLREFSHQTDDEQLSDDIQDWIHSVIAELDRFAENDDGSAIYEVSMAVREPVTEEYGWMTFRNYADAVETGKTLYREFFIAKCEIYDEEDGERIRDQIYHVSKPRLPPSGIVGRALCFSKGGIIEYSSPEMDKIAHLYEFQNKFYGFPIPFTRGSVVYHTDTHIAGVVETPLRKWMVNWQNHGSDLDARDVRILVSYYSRVDNKFFVRQTNPLYLESILPNSHHGISPDPGQLQFYRDCGKLLQSMPKNVTLEMLSSVLQFKPPY